MAWRQIRIASVQRPSRLLFLAMPFAWEIIILVSLQRLSKLVSLTSPKAAKRRE